MYLRRFIFITVVCLYYQVAISQNESLEDQVQQSESPGDAEDLLQELNDLYENPIFINSKDTNEINRLFLLNTLQLQSLKKYRSRYGMIYSIDELRNLTGFDANTINKIEPYIRFDITSTKKFEPEQDILIRESQTLEKQTGYLNGAFAGSPVSLRFRYKIKLTEHISAALLGDKDAGEEFLKNSQPYGFDHYSGNITLKDYTHVKMMIMGDYNCTFGQGLAIWNGFGLGKSSDIFSIRKNERHITPVASTDENNFLRGTAAEIKYKKSTIVVLLSQKKIDANIISDNHLSYATSLQTSGYHALRSELEDKHQLKESIIGFHGDQQIKHVKIGFTAYSLVYDKPFAPSSDLYNYYAFKGRTNQIFSSDIQYTRNNLSLFGEAAISEINAKSILAGVLANVSPVISISAVYRNYEKEYQSLLSNAFAENTKTSNEQGFYTGIQIQASQQLQITAYADHFQFPWCRFNIDGPSKGYDYLIQGKWTFTNSTSMMIKYRTRSKYENDFTGNIDHIMPIQYRNWRYQVNYKINENILGNNRVEYLIHTDAQQQVRTGFAIIQDIHVHLQKSNSKIIFRYALFDTDSYEERLYAYEPDAPMNFSIPSYYYKGYRFCILYTCSLRENIQFSARYGITHYADRKIISSDNYEIEGSNKSELKFQIRIKI